MSFPGAALPSFPVIPMGETNPKTTTPMSYTSLKAETDTITAKIQSIVDLIRTATLAELQVIEGHLGLARQDIAPETTTFRDFDYRLGLIVNELHNVESEMLDAVAFVLAPPVEQTSPTDPEAIPVPLTPEVNEITQAPADTTAENGAASSGASAEAANPDQPVS